MKKKRHSFTAWAADKKHLSLRNLFYWHEGYTDDVGLGVSGYFGKQRAVQKKRAEDFPRKIRIIVEET